jgi:hypothetical protein
MTNTNTTPAHTYNSAMIVLKRNARKGITDLLTWDAGEGFVGRGYYCADRKRIVTDCVTPSGIVIH